ncbi:ATP-binding cassette domain-containing protein [Agrobacterium vitis]|uniref:thiamine ABC transporter ATP-binding protein n=1 Tax=Allorhizobium ampelinum TaxID=3025782 RepID=UPI001F1ED8EF|nr:ATP-binding cassette domain-containing protein [Allorhizobium ampelinum]MCF1461577.1 ATP-binding cassette domain-containing protein [Allorhizobium ampelinum]
MSETAIIPDAAPIASIVLDTVQLRLGNQSFEFNDQIVSGKITAITGMSGSGKSTLLNLIAGFETPDQGRIQIGSEDITDLPPAKRPVSLVFQDHNLFAHLDLATNIGLGIDPSLRLSAADRLAVSEALKRVGLGGYDKRKPATLSGGEKQRAAFARALVRRKPVLLLDEPFAALDPGLRASMADLLLDLHRETGQSVLIVSHDPQDVRRLADDVLFLDQGRISLQCDAKTFLSGEGPAALKTFLGPFHDRDRF